MNFFKIERHEDGILLVYLDNPSDRMNTLSQGMLSELEELLDEISADHFARALAFISSKKDNFIVGADIRDFDKMTEPGQTAEIITRFHSLFNRIANLHYPVIAAINGPCLGGGLEFALACHFRMATDWEKTVLGLPETKLGLFPAAGGTQRLTRLAGVRRALPLMIKGKILSARQAKSLGIVDMVVFPSDLAGSVKRAIPYFLKKFPRKMAYPPAFSLDWLLHSFVPARKAYFKAARRRVAQQGGNHYPAPLRLIDCVETGIAGTMSDGLRAEAEAFGPLVLSAQSSALRQLFFNQTRLKKKHYSSAQPREISRIAVVGSGFMGTGIASVSAHNGYEVALKDVSGEKLSKSLREIWKHLDGRVRAKKGGPVERDKLFSRVVPTLDYAGLAGAGLVIEAVFEDLELKKDLLREVERHISPDCIFASNTSAIPISRIAAASSRPENVIGMHYFSPVPKMPLLEIIVTEHCADWVLATAVSVGRRQGKTVIVVRDGPGFYTSRILTPYMLEAIRLVEEGAAIEDIDNALQQFGFPVGPLKLLDEVGIDVAAHVSHELEEFFAHREIREPAALDEVLKSGWQGKKKGLGFYNYEPGLVGRLPLIGSRMPRPVNSKIYGFFGSGGRKRMDFSTVQKRLVYLMLNEAALCLQEGTIFSPEDGDLGAVFGLGFPSFLGGPFRYLDSVGTGRIVSEMEEMAMKFGDRFEPASILVRMAELQEKFYEVV